LAPSRKATTVASPASPLPSGQQSPGYLIPTPTPTAMPKTGKARDEGPNPFLAGENGAPGFLEVSYNEGVAYEVTVPGKFVEKEQRNRAGEVTGTRMAVTGDAERVVFFLRQAANLLDIGVRIVTVKGKGRDMITVKYLGQNRKAPRGSKKQREETAKSVVKNFNPPSIDE
jgi:hypothetical protein